MSDSSAHPPILEPMNPHSRDASAVFLAASLRALLTGTCSPDAVVEAYDRADAPVPLIVDDPVISSDLPQGLLLWAAEARRSGIDSAYSVLLHPTLPHRVPRTDKEHRRALARSSSVTVLEAEGTSRALVLLSADAAARVIPTAPVRTAPLGSVSAPEAVRALRECTMEGVGLVEELGDELPENLRQAPWRDWQADLAVGRLSESIGALLDEPRYAASLVTAFEIHSMLRPVLAPHTLQPPRFGEMLARLHAAAAAVVTAVTRGL